MMIAGPALVDYAMPGPALRQERARRQPRPRHQRGHRRRGRHRGRGLRHGPPVPVVPAHLGRRAAAPRQAAPTTPIAATTSSSRSCPGTRATSTRCARSSSASSTARPTAPRRSSRSGGSGASRSSRGLARLDGWPVVLFAEDPYIYGGAWTAASSQKVTRAIDLASTFHLPLVHLVDCPGFLIGLQSEQEATIRHGSHALAALGECTSPYCSVVIRKAFGVAGAANNKAGSFHYRYAWPSGDWGSLPIEGGIEVAYKAELAEAPDRDAHLAAIKDRLEQGALAVPHRRGVRHRGDHRPARHPPAAVPVGRARGAGPARQPPGGAVPPVIDSTKGPPHAEVSGSSTSARTSAGAYCARLLASCGADVTLVEPPEGDPLRHQPPLPHAARPHRAGEHPARAPQRLQARHRRRPVHGGRAARCSTSCWPAPTWCSAPATATPSGRWPSSRTIRTRWPDCVHVVTSPFGLTGPYASYKGGELISWACGGFLQITGDPDRPPVQGGGPWADYATGATAAIGALAAVRSGDRSARRRRHDGGDGRLPPVEPRALHPPGRGEEAGQQHARRVVPPDGTGAVQGRLGGHRHRPAPPSGRACASPSTSRSCSSTSASRTTPSASTTPTPSTPSCSRGWPRSRPTPSSSSCRSTGCRRPRCST